MSSNDETVEIYPAAEDMTDTARRLLAAAEDLDVRVEAVETVSGGFRVPAEVAKKAGEHVDAPAKAPAKKTAAKAASSEK